MTAFVAAVIPDYVRNQGSHTFRWYRVCKFIVLHETVCKLYSVKHGNLYFMLTFIPSSVSFPIHLLLQKSYMICSVVLVWKRGKIWWTEGCRWTEGNNWPCTESGCSVNTAKTQSLCNLQLRQDSKEIHRTRFTHWAENWTSDDLVKQNHKK